MNTPDPTPSEETPGEPPQGPNLRLAAIVGTVMISALLIGVLYLRDNPYLSAERSVVASIAPLHSLVSGVMAGVESPVLLMPAGVSPHAYTPRPSDMEAFYRARLVIWVDPGVESVLPRLNEALAPGVFLLQVGSLDGVTRLPARTGGAWEQGDGHADGEEEHGAEASDPHTWLDPQNAIAWVKTIADNLAQLEPQHAARFRENADGLINHLRLLDADLRAQLAPLAGVPYLVYHDAYRYLESRYGLTPVGAFAIAADSPPGAKRLVEMRRLVEERGVRCLFVEPQFRPQQAEALVAETGVRVATLDPLGVGLPPGPDLYFTLMRNLADALVDCLGAG